MTEREAEQEAVVAKAWVNIVPSFARASRWGVSITEFP